MMTLLPTKRGTGHYYQAGPPAGGPLAERLVAAVEKIVREQHEQTLALVKKHRTLKLNSYANNIYSGYVGHLGLMVRINLIYLKRKVILMHNINVQNAVAYYLIDYANGTIPISDLPIGTRVVDTSWAWEFRAGDNFSGSGKVKPVTWIVVAKDHYEGLELHITLLAEESIGKYVFDNSTNRNHTYAEYGYNHWGDCGTANATCGLRPWLNSTGIRQNFTGKSFYRSFSKLFKRAVLETTLPNMEWTNRTIYTTSDKVFVPTITELGLSMFDCPLQIGTAYAYFAEGCKIKPEANHGGKPDWYWTRSPDYYCGAYVCLVVNGGESHNIYMRGYAAKNAYGVRPALNLKSGILVSEIRN